MRRTLIFFDGTDLSIKALNHALAFSDKGDTINVMYIVDEVTYDNIKKGISSIGGGEHELHRALTEFEHRFRKQLSIFMQQCRERAIEVHTKFKVGNVEDEVVKEITENKYDLIIIPYSAIYKGKIIPILSRILSSYEGNVLIVK